MEVMPQLKVLIVDDEPTMRHLLRRWIEKLTPCELFEAENGLEALEIVSTTQIDMLLTDLNMPVLDGVDMISLIKSDPATASMEIAVVSVVAVETKVRDILKLGVTDYLLKPLQYDQVIHRLQQIVQRAATKARKREARGGNQESRVLVCDADVNFCEFADSALSSAFAVQVSQSVAKTLVLALQWQPNIVLMTDNLSGTKIEFLIDKVKKVSGDSPSRIFRLTDSKSPPLELDSLDGTIRKSFVPDAFLAAVRNALSGVEVSGDGPLGWTAELEPEIDSGVRQTFGMMTGEEPESSDEGPANPEIHGAITVDAESGDFRLVVEIICEKSLARQLVCVMLQLKEDETSDDMLDSGVNEILNVVAGRIKNSCARRDLDTRLGLPETGPEPICTVEEPIVSNELHFQWRHEYRFTLRFLAETARAASEGVAKPEGTEQPTVNPSPAEEPAEALAT